MPYTAYVIEYDEVVHIIKNAKQPTLAQLQNYVRGYIETVPYFTKAFGLVRGRAYCNEEGCILQLYYNKSASEMWKACYSNAGALFGPVVITFKDKEPKS
jgi:hypothetical protein